jgi:hypothetical protein
MTTLAELVRARDRFRAGYAQAASTMTASRKTAQLPLLHDGQLAAQDPNQ